jgi:hypothetical protein
MFVRILEQDVQKRRTKYEKTLERARGKENVDEQKGCQ